MSLSTATLDVESMPAAAPLERPSQPVRRIGLLDRLFSPFVMTVYALLLGLGLGLGSAYWVLQGDYPFGRVRIGPWVAWPTIGSAQADPYARAIVAKRGDIPLATGEGLALRAAADGAGRPLDAACTYRIAGATPQTRFWTLAVYGRDGALVRTDLQRSGFTSVEILRDAGDRVAVLLSREPQPGNWIQLPADGPFSLTLRLYDMPGVAGAGQLAADALPAIERLGCAS